jgi:carbon-monoxide dehydrogenase iron sulfur subunit
MYYNILCGEIMKKIMMVNNECDNCGDCVKACMELHKIGRIAILEHKEKYLPIVCQHCASAPCKEVCPVEAIYHLEDGTVYLDEEKCIGCGLCPMACPFGAIVMTEVANKCILCFEQDECACVKACSKRCLEVVEVNDTIFSKRDKVIENFAKLNKASSGNIGGGNIISKIASSAKVGNPLKQ